ncbi:MAG TPA: hypothetical protein DEF61_04245, partial [Firmicutes bacterium]|nr:hypothetical protein [Bacillota bacterium]
GIIPFTLGLIIISSFLTPILLRIFAKGDSNKNQEKKEA